MNQNGKKILRISFIILFMILFASHWLKSLKIKKDVLEHNEITIGRLTEYFDGGADFSAKKVVYSYNALSKSYTREINVTYKFEICEDFNKCKDKRYWVIYSPDNPKNSLINLEIEIQGIDNPEFPKDLNDFK